MSRPLPPPAYWGVPDLKAGPVTSTTRSFSAPRISAWGPCGLDSPKAMVPAGRSEQIRSFHPLW